MLCATDSNYQALACRLTGFTIPLAHGQGFFFGSVGLLPFQVPINVVVGAPIIVEQYDGECITLNPCFDLLHAYIPFQQTMRRMLAK